MNKPSIFIADDHPLLLKGLEDLLLEKNMNLIGSATDGRSALNFILKEAPEIAILDVEMPELSGLEVAKECYKHKLKTKIILITLHKEIELYLSAKKLNIFGYLLKEFAIDEIETCITSVSKGVPYFSEKIKSLIGFTAETNTVLNVLTSTEKRILKLISSHKNNKEIAHILFISPRTVEKHRSNIIKKLNIDQKRNSLAIWVLKNNHLFK